MTHPEFFTDYWTAKIVKFWQENFWKLKFSQDKRKFHNQLYFNIMIIFFVCVWGGGVGGDFMEIWLKNMFTGFSHILRSLSHSKSRVTWIIFMALQAVLR